MFKPTTYWGERFQSLGAYIIIISILFFVGIGIRSFFPKKSEATSKTAIKTIESGGIANITNINNPVADLKQGIYLRGASDKVSIGVFKEVMPSIDVSIGVGKKYDDDSAFAEVETRFKF